MRRTAPRSNRRTRKRSSKSLESGLIASTHSDAQGDESRRARSLLALFESLDFVYLPSRDVAADIAHFAALGANVVFAIEAFGTRVAMVELAERPPPLLLAGHLEGDQPVLVYRVSDLEQSISELRERGVDVAARFGIPHGPGAELVMPGPQRLALYELTRLEAPERLAGRRDF